MADFSYLRSAQITPETTTEYKFWDIPGVPSIILAPAIDANPAYLEYRIRLAAKDAEEAKNEKVDPLDVPVTPEIVKADQERARERDRKIIAHACARGWGVAPFDAYGAQPEFSVENCLDFLRAVPDWIFDPMRPFVQNVRNFTPDVVDGRKLGNESPSS